MSEVGVVHRIDKASDYRWFFHSKSYIKGKSEAYRIKKEPLSVSKHSNPTLPSQREAWDALEQPVPLRYLEEIGVSLSTLGFTLELDQEEYEKALSFPFYPKEFLVRIAPSVFSVRPLCMGTSESQAVSLLQRLSKTCHSYFAIVLPDIKTIFVSLGQSAYTEYYRPQIEIKDDVLFPSPRGVDLAVVG